MLDTVPFDLGRFPALRHLKIEWRSSYENDSAFFRFLPRLLSMSSSNGIEVLEMKITWCGIKNEYGKNLLSFKGGWSRLDQLLTSQTSGSLRKVVLCLGTQYWHWTWAWQLEGNVSHPKQNLELEKDWPFSYVNDLSPLFRALKGRESKH